MDVKDTKCSVDVKDTKCSVDERAFHLHDETCDTATKLSRTLQELTPRERALIRPHMVIDAIVETASGKRLELLEKLLLDTGSLDGNYIGRKFLSLHPDLSRDRQPYDGIVYMADNKSHARIKEKVLL